MYNVNGCEANESSLQARALFVSYLIEVSRCILCESVEASTTVEASHSRLVLRLQMLRNDPHRQASRPSHSSSAPGQHTVRKLPSVASPLSKLNPAPLNDELQQGLLATQAQSSGSIAGGWAAPSGSSIFLQQRHEVQTRSKLRLGWAGAGIYFFWQLGAMKYLSEHYDLTKIKMAGASAGSFISVLSACGVEADKIIESAYAMSLEHDIWSRPLGLMGTWGSLIEKWLDELLPHNAADICRGRVDVVVSIAPVMTQVAISDFRSKQDLIDVCMASAHVPLFLDKRLMRPCRDMHCVDGSFPDFFTGENSELITNNGAVVFDYFDDPNLNRTGRLDMLSIKQYDEIKQMMRKGYLYAARLRKAGRFHHFDVADAMDRSFH